MRERERDGQKVIHRHNTDHQLIKKEKTTYSSVGEIHVVTEHETELQSLRSIISV